MRATARLALSGVTLAPGRTLARVTVLAVATAVVLLLLLRPLQKAMPGV